MMLNCVGRLLRLHHRPNTFALVVTAVQNLDMPCSLTPQLRRVQPHHRQAIGHLHQRPHRLRRRGQDHRRRVRRRPRPRRLRGRAHLQQPGLGRLPRLQHPQLQGAGPRRLLQPRLQHRLPRLRLSADLHHHRGAHRHGGREGRHRPLGVPLQERGPAGRPHHQQPPVSGLRLSRRCSRRPSRSTTSTRPRPKRPGPRAGTWAWA